MFVLKCTLKEDVILLVDAIVMVFYFIFNIKVDYFIQKFFKMHVI